MVKPDDGAWLGEDLWPPDPLSKEGLSATELDDWQMITAYDSQQPFYSTNGIDRTAARRLLRQLSASTLSERWNYSPTIEAILRSIVKHPQVKGNKPAPRGAPDERFGISGVIIDDPELIDLSPDVAVGPVPAWIADLDDETRREYYHHRAGCMSSSVSRQRWFAARHRYDLRDAERGPDEINVVDGQHGPVLHLWWD